MAQDVIEQEVDLEAGFALRLGEHDRMLAVAAEGHLGAWLKLLLLSAPTIDRVEIKAELWRDETQADPMGYELTLRLVPGPGAATPGVRSLKHLEVAAPLIFKAAEYALREGMRPKYTALFDMLPNDGDSMAEAYRFARQDMDWGQPVPWASALRLRAMLDLPVQPSANELTLDHWIAASLDLQRWNEALAATPAKASLTP